MWQNLIHDLLKHMQLCRITTLTLCAAALATASARAADAAATPEGELPPATSRKVDFARDLQPLFAERCYDCHGEKKQESAFRADNRADLLKGGDHGPALVVGKSAESTMVLVLAGLHEDIAAMPKKREKLTPEQIGLVRAWIDQGAEWAEATIAKKQYNTN
ncbi:MAG: hypothetical protein EPO07_13815, partial [Verrucomicrobia bacterium]